MTPISPIDTVKSPEAPLFDHDEAINELQTNEIAEPVQNEAPTYLSEIKIEGDGPKPERRFKINKPMAIGGAALLAAILTGAAIFGGIKSSNNNNNAGGETGIGGEPTEDSSAVETDNTTAATIDSESSTVTLAPSETTTQTTTSKTSGETINNAEYDYSKPLENAVECYGFEKLAADQQAEIKKMEAMTIEEFQALPEADQLKFSYWVFENYKGRFDFILQTADVKINLEYTQTPTTPQEYADNYAYVETMASSIFTNKVRADGTSSTGNVTDILTGQKIMALRDTATDAHNKGNNSYIARFKDLVILAEVDYSVTGYKAIENGMVLNMHQDATDTVPVDFDAADGQRTMTEVTFEDINGKEVTISVCSLAIPISDSRAIPVTAVN